MNILLPGLEMGTNYAVQIKPSGPDHLKDDWSPIFYFQTVIDTNPPPKPSTPILSSGLGTIIAEWDGEDSDGNRMYDVAPDTAAVEVHVSDVSGFTPSPATLSGHIMRVGQDGGKWVISKTLDSGVELPYGVDVFVKFVAIDLTNLQSPPSDEANSHFSRVSGLDDIEAGTIGPDLVSFEYGGIQSIASDTEPTDPPFDLSAGDIWLKTGDPTGATLYRYSGTAWVKQSWGNGALGPGSVGTNQLAANSIVAGSAVIGTGAITSVQIGTGAIVNAKIADAAIDNAKIANVAAGKITSDTLNASIILGGSIATATSGSRVTMNSAGLFFYNSSGANTIAMNSNTGSATFTGQFLGNLFRSTANATGGSAYVEMGQTGLQDPTDELRMWNGSRVASLRNPSDRPGVARVSANEFGSSQVSNFGYYGLEVSKLASPTWPSSQYINMNTSSGIVLQPWNGGNGLSISASADGNGHMTIGPYAGTTARLKFLNGTSYLQVRNNSDTGYSTLAAVIADQSSPELKEDITELNIDAVGAVSQVKLRAWNWKDDAVEPDKRLPGIGLLTTDLPQWMTDRDGYYTGTLLATCAQAIGELNARITELESKVA